jgi:lamin tail-like protein
MWAMCNSGVDVAWFRLLGGMVWVCGRPAADPHHTPPLTCGFHARLPGVCAVRTVVKGDLVSVSVSVTARRLTAAAAVAAACVGAVALPAPAADHTPDRARSRVGISAVQYDFPGRDDRSNRSLNREWVDITYTGRRDVNLDGWTLSDEDGHTYTFDRFRLDGRSTVRVHTGRGRDTATARTASATTAASATAPAAETPAGEA